MSSIFHKLLCLGKKYWKMMVFVNKWMIIILILVLRIILIEFEKQYNKLFWKINKLNFELIADNSFFRSKMEPWGSAFINKFKDRVFGYVFVKHYNTKTSMEEDFGGNLQQRISFQWRWMRPEIQIIENEVYSWIYCNAPWKKF